MGDLQIDPAQGDSPTLADFLFWNCPDSTEWHLNPKVVHKLFHCWSRPQVDLLTTHTNHQLPCWFCWTGHLLVTALDTLSQPWMGLSHYAPTPIPLPERILIKIMEEKAEEVIVITPSWPGRFWYHMLLQMACEVSLLLP